MLPFPLKTPNQAIVWLGVTAFAAFSTPLIVKTVGNRWDYGVIVWSLKYEGESRCTTPNLDEDEIKGRFHQAFATLFSAKERVLDECRTIQTALTDCTAIDEELVNLLEEMELLAAMTRQCIEENSRNAQDQDEFNAKYNRLVEKYETAKAKVETLQTQRAARLNEADSIGAFMFTLYEMETAAQEFDPKLWITAIDRATVHSDGTITFCFIGGMKITA